VLFKCVKIGQQQEKVFFLGHLLLYTLTSPVDSSGFSQDSAPSVTVIKNGRKWETVTCGGDLCSTLWQDFVHLSQRFMRSRNTETLEYPQPEHNHLQYKQNSKKFL